MAAPSAWRVLVNGPGEDLVLAVDFSVTNRAEATFTDLFSTMEINQPVWETRQPAGPMSFEEYVSWWAEEVQRDGRAVRAVLGYCVGSVYAAELGRWLGDQPPAGGGRAPAVILVEPQVPTIDGLADDFTSAVERLCSACERDAARDASRRARDESTGLADFGARLVEIFGSAMDSRFTRVSLGDLGGELTEMFRLFVSYVVAADGADLPSRWAEATAISGTPPTRWAKLAGRELRFDVDHSAVLRDPEVAQAVCGLVA